MGSPFTIIQGKEGPSPKSSVFLISITPPDGSGNTCYLTTRAYVGAPNIRYNGQTYMARILNNQILPLQAGSPQGYDSVPGFTVTIADADLQIWNNYCRPNGWRGAVVTLIVILWDVVANQYSTDAYKFTFIGGNPQHSHASGETTLDTMASTNYARLKIPSIPLEFTCPWDYPGTFLERWAALNDPTSIFYQCGHSCDQPGGFGNTIVRTDAGHPPNPTVAGAILATDLAVTITTVPALPVVPFQAVMDSEEVLVTAVAGLTLTIARAQHGTAAAGHSAGATFFIPFPTCDQTRSGGPGGNPTVGCMARNGNGSATTVAPDGDLEHDIAGNYTATFGGITLVMPSTYSGRNYVSSQKLFGYNTPNAAIVGSYFTWVIGTQWVNAQVLAPAADPNSMRSEAYVCTAAFGAGQVLMVVVNGVVIPHDGSDSLLTWRFPNEANYPSNGSGTRHGAMTRDNYYRNSTYSALGDPHGSGCVIEFVVHDELAASGSSPTVQVLVTGDYLLNCYPIASAVGTGGEITITFAAGVVNLLLASGSKVFLANNTLAAANGAFTVDSATGATIVLRGTAATGSGTGGGAFFFAPPDLYENDLQPNYDNTIVGGASANGAWAVLTLMTWGNTSAAQFDAPSWYAAAQICLTALTFVAADGSTQTHAQYKVSLALEGSSRQSLAQVLTAVKNACNLMTGANSNTGLIQAFVKQTMADQQPAPIPGSNYNTAVPSPHADSTIAVPHIGSGFFAYLFNESNIDKTSFKITTTRIESTPNTVAFSFQDARNAFQTDSLTETDPAAYAYSGNQLIEVPVPMAGIDNFDQGTRCANVQISEAIYGNYRDDPGGTIYVEFRTNQRVMHLTARLGFICGLQWAAEQIGLINPQAFRLMTLQPDTDGEHWTIKMSWHVDDWYLYAYGQDPTPYQVNPLLTTQFRPPYPWRPGQFVWGPADALFANMLGFSFSVDLTQYPAQVSIVGIVPINAQPPSGVPPLGPMQAASAPTGGFIKPGPYQIQFSANGLLGPVQLIPSVVNVPPGTNTNTITVSGINWRGVAAAAVQPFLGTSSLTMIAEASADYVGSEPDANGNPTSFTFTRYSADGDTALSLAPPLAGLGLPDINFQKFLVEEYGIEHGGDWGDNVGAVSGAGLVLTFPASKGLWPVNQWQGHILALYFRPNLAPGTQQPALNVLVSSSDGSTLTMAAAGFLVHDVVVMRPVATTFSPNTIGDSALVSTYAPAGLNTTGDEYGRLILIIAGTGKGGTPKTIKSNTASVYTIEGEFDTPPDATSIWLVLSPTVNYAFFTKAFSASAAGIAAIATTPAISTDEASLLIIVFACDSNGNASPEPYQPMREVYVPAQPPALAVNLVYPFTQTLAPVQQVVNVDATGGPGILTLPPFSEWIGESILIVKTDVSANSVEWQTTSPDTVLGGLGSSGSLSAQNAWIEITAVAP